MSVLGHTRADGAFWLSAWLGLALAHPSWAAQETGPGLWSGLCPPRRVAGWGLLRRHPAGLSLQVGTWERDPGDCRGPATALKAQGASLEPWLGSPGTWGPCPCPQPDLQLSGQHTISFPRENFTKRSGAGGNWGESQGHGESDLG